LAARKRVLFMLKALWKRFKAVHRDERGADTVEYILLIAIIALPLLGLILVFKEKIYAWVNDLWERITGQACSGS
jgi:Flp pilus assembly pilin Flp